MEEKNKINKLTLLRNKKIGKLTYIKVGNILNLKMEYPTEDQIAFQMWDLCGAFVLNFERTEKYISFEIKENKKEELIELRRELFLKRLNLILKIPQEK